MQESRCDEKQKNSNFGAHFPSCLSNQNQMDKKILHEAATAGDMETLRANLPERAVNIGDYERVVQAMRVAIRNGRSECLGELGRIAQFAKDKPSGALPADRVSGEDSTALLFAAIERKDADCVRALLPMVDVNRPLGGEVWALPCAAQVSWPDIVGLLLEEGADASQKNAQGLTAFEISAENGFAENVRVFLAANPQSATARDKNGMTALMRAARDGDVAVLSALLSASDLSAQDNNGLTAVQWAVQSGNDDGAALLAERQPGSGDLLFSPDPDDGETTLMRAARQGMWQTVKALAANGDPNASSKRHGPSALVVAIHAGASRCVEILAPLTDPAKKSASGKTALELAEARMARVKEFETEDRDLFHGRYNNKFWERDKLSAAAMNALRAAAGVPTQPPVVSWADIGSALAARAARGKGNAEPLPAARKTGL